MSIWFNKRGEEYYGETEKQWWKKYIERLFKEHREKTPIDHPDGSVTDEKIGERTVTSDVSGRTVKAYLTGHIENLIQEIDVLEENMKDADAELAEEIKNTVSKHAELTASDIQTGHVKLTSDLRVAFDVDDGVAVTPKATNELYQNIEEHKSEFDTLNKLFLSHKDLKAGDSIGHVQLTDNPEYTGGEEAKHYTAASGVCANLIYQNIEDHKKESILDHPDGSVTDEKIGTRTVTYPIANKTETRTLTEHLQSFAESIDYIDEVIETEVMGASLEHIRSTDNPHSVTKEQIGLGNVDNTSDMDKPVSAAVREALDEKAPLEHTHNDMGLKTYSNTDINTILESGVYELIYDDGDLNDYNLTYGMVGAINTVDISGEKLTAKLIVNTVRYEEEAVETDGVLFVPYEEYCYQSLSTINGTFSRTGYRIATTSEEAGVGFEFSEWETSSGTATKDEVSKLSEEIEALPNNETLIDNVAEVVKAEVPLVKTAEQPTFINSVDEMTDTSKVYVMPDGYLYAYTLPKVYTLTADDFTAGSIGAVGDLNAGDYNNRIVTTELWSLTDKVVSVNCPEPYQYIVYYFSANSDTSDYYLGKTSFKSGNIDDVSTDVVADGTSSGATYCRISLRDSTNPSADLTDRVYEFMHYISVTHKADADMDWYNTGLAYNQPADYEDRIVALENALEGLEYGTY